MLDMASLTAEQKKQVKAAAKAAKEKAIKRQIEQIQGIHGTRKDGKNRFQPPCSYEELTFSTHLMTTRDSPKSTRIGCGFGTNFEKKIETQLHCVPL